MTEAKTVSAFRVIAIFLVVVLTAFAAFSGVKTAVILKEKMGIMVRQNADFENVFEIIKKVFSGIAEKSDGEKAAFALLGL